MGRVLAVQGGAPMPDAHLQIVGTTFVTFSDHDGEHVLTFDASLLDQRSHRPRAPVGCVALMNGPG